MRKCIHCGRETLGLICDNFNCKQKGKVIVSPFMLTEKEMDLMSSLCSNEGGNGGSETTPISHRHVFELLLDEAINSAEDMVSVERKGIREQAENGDIDAQRTLGISLLREKMPEAYIWLKRAGTKGDIIALIGMARCYLRGFGINDDGDNIKPSESLGHLIEDLTHSYLCSKIDYETIIQILKTCLTCQDSIERLNVIEPLTDEGLEILRELGNHVSND